MRANARFYSSAKNADDSRGAPRSFGDKKPSPQDDIKFNFTGEKKLWQSKSYMEKSHGRRFSAE